MAIEEDMSVLQTNITLKIPKGSRVVDAITRRTDDVMACILKVQEEAVREFTKEFGEAPNFEKTQILTYFTETEVVCEFCEFPK